MKTMKSSKTEAIKHTERYSRRHRKSDRKLQKVINRLVRRILLLIVCSSFFFFSRRRGHTRLQGDWSSDVCSSDLWTAGAARGPAAHGRLCPAAGGYHL